MTFVLIAFALVVSATFGLKVLNLRHLRAHGNRVPPELEGSIDADLLRRISAYTIATSRLGTVQSLVHSILVVAFLFGGVLGWYDGWIAARASSLVWSGLLFFVLLLVAESVLGIPFSLARNFGIENRYGFNTMGVRLWLTDLLKTLVLSTVFLAILVAGALLLVSWSPRWWWLWVWGFFLVFSLFLMYVSPYVIEPLFFKMEPLKIEGLEEQIRDLLRRADLRIQKVLQVDASRRSRHSNAYFTGIGKVKRIVLFDTLLDQMAGREILAVLAHEAGHWKRRHVFKRIVLTETLALGAFFVAFRLLAWDGLPGLVGLEQASFHGRVLIAGFLGSLAAFPLTPLSSWLSRRYEWEADRFAVELTHETEHLASALAKLARENLANLHPHPLYARFYGSHPPIVQRIRRLRPSGQPEDRS